METPERVEFSVELSGGEPVILVAVVSQDAAVTAAWTATKELAEQVITSLPLTGRTKMVGVRYVWKPKS